MRVAPAATLAFALAACGGGGDAADPPSEAAAASHAPSPSPGPPESESAPAPAARWYLESDKDGATLALQPGGVAGPGAAIHLSCPAGGNRLLVNLPGVRPIASEERLSFGSGGEVVALVADVNGDPRLGGVTGTAPVPERLDNLIAGAITASYGAQRSGPHPAPPRALASAFVAACRPKPAATAAVTAPAPPDPCRVQGGERLTMIPLRAIGTEPFWGARIEGRCVTYSHPDEQAGTRIWTRYAADGTGGRWTGALGGRPFVLVTRAAPGCSDGMSDNRYPLAVTLTVNGERRTGCAAPA